VGGIVIGVNDAETENILKMMRNWLLIGAGSIILLILDLLLIYNGNHAPKIVYKIIAVIQFGLIIIVIIFYLKLRKLKKQVIGTKNQEELTS
jgi:glucan phosphoethanolaminetransferase (alkaline phosphatase superfamily)